MRTGNFTQQPINVNVLSPDGTAIGNANLAPGQSSDLLVQPKQPGIYGLEALDTGNNLIGRVPIMIIGQLLTPDMIGQTITAPWYTIQTRQNGEVLLHHTATGPDGIRGEAFEHIGPNSNVLMEEGPPAVTSSTVGQGTTWQLHTTGAPPDFQSSLQSTTTIESINTIHPWAAVIFPSSVSGFTMSWAGKSAITPKQTKQSVYWDPDPASGWSSYTFISVRNVASGSETVTVKFYDQSGEILTDPIYRVAIEKTGAGKLLVAEAVLGTLRVIPAETAKEVLVNGPGDMSNLARLTITEAGQISNVTLYPIDSSWPQKILRGIP